LGSLPSPVIGADTNFYFPRIQDYLLAWKYQTVAKPVQKESTFEAVLAFKLCFLFNSELISNMTCSVNNGEYGGKDIHIFKFGMVDLWRMSRPKLLYDPSNNKLINKFVKKIPTYDDATRVVI
jgi:hypothetical protein